MTDWTAIQFPLLCVGGYSLLTARAGSRPNASGLQGARFQVTALLGLVLTTVATIVAILILTRYSGTSWAGIQYGLIGQHSGFADGFFHPVNVKPFAITLLLVSGCGLVYSRGDTSPGRIGG